MASVPIGGVRVDLTLNSAAFIKDIAKTNAAIAGSTKQMTSQLNRLQQVSKQVGATFGAWITARAARQVINFFDRAIDQAAKLNSTLGMSAKQFQNNAEAMSNAFRLGAAQGVIIALEKGLAQAGISMEALAKAGLIAGQVLGTAFTVIVDVLTILLPEALKLTIQNMNILINLVNSAIGKFNDLNEWFNTSLAGRALGLSATSGNLGLIPTIDASGITSWVAGMFNLAGASDIARDSLTQTTQAQAEMNKQAQVFSDLANMSNAVFEQARTPLEEYAVTVERLNFLLREGGIDAETWQRAHTQATLGILSTGLGAASAMTGALADLFKENKAFAIANAVINTAEAITSALKNPPGPPFSYVYAASAAIAGAAQIATILSASPGSSKAITKPSAGGTTGAAKAGSASKGFSPGQTVTINVVGDVFGPEHFRKIVSGINGVQRDGTALLRVA